MEDDMQLDSPQQQRQRQQAGHEVIDLSHVDFASSSSALEMRPLTDFEDDEEEATDQHSLLLHADVAGEQQQQKETKKDGEGAAVQEEVREEPFGWRGVRRLMALARPELWLLLGGMAALAVTSGSVLVIPYYAGRIVDEVSKRLTMPLPGNGTNSDSSDSSSEDDAADTAALARYGLVLFVWFCVGAVFTFVRSLCFHLSGERIVARLRRDVFAHVVRQEVGYFDRTRTGDIINRLSSDCSVMQSALSLNISMGLRNLGQVVGGVVILFVVSWRLTLVMLSVTPVVSICAVIYGRWVRRLATAVQDALAKATSIAEESISAMRTVRSFSAERHEMRRYDEEIAHTYALGVKMSFATASFLSIATFAATCALLAVLYYGGVLVLDREMTPGQLMSFLVYSLTVAFAMGTLASLYADLMKAVGASKRVFEMLDRQPQVRYEGGLVPHALAGELRLEQVHFAYPTRPDAPVLRGISLRLSPGKVVALVGPSGGGKSTCISLIELFYYPQQGRLTLDGVDLSEIDPNFLHRTIGLVSQEPVLFAMSIRENIAYGLPEAPLERIIEVAKQSNAHDFIMSFPAQYETQVGERGIKLSGGQKQRVAIARALLNNPKILLLDEATSALDAESEHLVQQALDRLMIGRTVLVIAHRLSTVKNADQVIVIDAGQFVESGTHSELLAKDTGLYRKLVARQLQSH